MSLFKVVTLPPPLHVPGQAFLSLCLTDLAGVPTRDPVCEVEDFDVFPSREPRWTQ
jgi:hypothetical protein